MLPGNDGTTTLYTGGHSRFPPLWTTRVPGERTEASAFGTTGRGAKQRSGCWSDDVEQSAGAETLVPVAMTMTNASTTVDTSSDDVQRSLLDRARRGDFAAFETLVEELEPRVYRLALRMLRQSHDAEDVTQQTFLSLIEHLKQFRGESTVAAWVLRIAANHALKLMRKRRGTITTPWEDRGSGEENSAPLPHPDFIAPWRDTPADLAEREEVRRLIDQSMMELDDKYRLVFLLRDVEGLSVRETAEILGLSESNVKVRLLRARLQLRERLTRVLGDETRRVVHEHADLPNQTNDV